MKWTLIFIFKNVSLSSAHFLRARMQTRAGWNIYNKESETDEIIFLRNRYFANCDHHSSPTNVYYSYCYRLFSVLRYVVHTSYTSSTPFLLFQSRKILYIASGECLFYRNKAEDQQICLSSENYIAKLTLASEIALKLSRKLHNSEIFHEQTPRGSLYKHFRVCWIVWNGCWVQLGFFTLMIFVISCKMT